MESFDAAILRDDYTYPWERDKEAGETAAAFAAFVTYRDLPPRSRSLRKAAAAHYHDDPEAGVGRAKVVQFEKWSAEYDWQVRVEAWDDERDRVRRQAHLRAVEDMAERHARDAAAAQNLALLPLRYLANRLSDEEGRKNLQMEMQLLGLKDQIRLAFLGERLLPRLQLAERLARGEPTEIVQGELGVSVEGTVQHLHGIAVVKRLLATEEGVEALDAIGRLGLPGGDDAVEGLEDDGPE